MPCYGDSKLGHGRGMDRKKNLSRVQATLRVGGKKKSSARSGQIARNLVGNHWCNGAPGRNLLKGRSRKRGPTFKKTGE